MLKKILLILIVVLALSISVSHGYNSINLNIQQDPLQSQTCTYLSPQDIQTAYNFIPLYDNGINGSGESIAIIVAHGDPSLLQDVDTFDSFYGLSKLTNDSNLIIEQPFGTPSFYPANWTSETALDVEVIHSLAPGARIYVIVSPNDSWLFQTVNYTIKNIPTNVISLSWGSSELYYNQQEITYLNSMFNYAQSRGINVFVASGDTGAYNSQNTPNVNFPASSPDVIAVGGTTLSIYSDGTYKSEVGWNGSGGGESQFFSKPPFQPDIGSYRMVPDVSFNAGTPLCIYVNSQWGGFYGTSAAAPSWAAIDSLINQQLNGDKGYLDSSLYSLYKNVGNFVFNNITSGCNGLYCANGKYNEVTGLGSPKVYQLVEALSNTSYEIYFNDSSNGIFNVNGKNYTKSVTIKFTFGQKIGLLAYSNQNNPSEKIIFTSFSGLVDTNENNTSFFVNSSGIINIEFFTYLKVNEYYYNGIENTSTYIKNGSSLNISAPNFGNFTNYNYVLEGFNIDNGTLIQKSNYKINVLSPLNISFNWIKNFKVNFTFLTTVTGLKANVSYYSNVPLTKSLVKNTKTINDGGYVYATNDSILYVYTKPQIIDGNRYLIQNFSSNFRKQITINFIKEENYTIDFISAQNISILPSKFYIKFNNITEENNNYYIWAPINTTIIFENATYDNANLNINYYLTTNSQNNITIKLPVSNIGIKVVTILGIPVAGATITININNISFRNSTDLFGSATFLSIPEKTYTVTINAYSSNYTFKNLNDFSNTFSITAGLYELYIILGVITLALILLLLFERFKPKKHK